MITLNVHLYEDSEVSSTPLPGFTSVNLELSAKTDVGGRVFPRLSFFVDSKTADVARELGRALIDAADKEDRHV